MLLHATAAPCCSSPCHRAVLERSQTLFLLLQEPQNAPATLQDAATGAAGAAECSCSAPGRCICCFRSHKTLLQCSQTLQLVLQEQQNAPTTLPDAASGTSGATERSCNAPNRLLLLQLRIYHPEPRFRSRDTFKVTSHRGCICAAFCGSDC